MQRGVPAFAAGNAQVGGQQDELVAGRGAYQRRVAHAALAHVRHQHWPAAVQVGPVQRVAAGGKIDLFAVGQGLVGEVGEQVRGQWRLMCGGTAGAMRVLHAAARAPCITRRRWMENMLSPVCF